MQRYWLVPLVLGLVVLAGCSSPGGGASSQVSYPDGWGADGPDDVDAAIDQSASAAGDGDFVEQWVTVERTESGMEQPYLITETVVRVDRENERLLREKRFFLVDNETAASVAASGSGPLADRRADEVIANYFDAGGETRYHRLETRTPRTTQESGSFASATDRRLPAALVGSAPVLESAVYSSPEDADSGVGYAISNVNAFNVDDGDGRLVVGDDGVVASYNFTEAADDDHETFRYSLEAGDVTVEPPEWAGQSA